MGLLARQTNAKWALKSPVHSKISFNALSNLNLIYINSIKSLYNDQFDIVELEQKFGVNYKFYLIN